MSFRFRADCPICGRINRRTFLADVGLGFTGLAMGAMLHREGIVRADAPADWTPPDGRPHFPPRAKSVIWVFLSGGLSHLESFDPKPALTKYAGKTFAETPYADPLQSPLFHERSLAVVGGERPYPKIFPLQVGFKKHGQVGVEISDWWPNLATCVDELAFVRSMYTTDELGFHAVEHPHYVTDIRATVLHGLGLDSRRLDVPGRKRLEIDHGSPIREILS